MKQTKKSGFKEFIISLIAIFSVIFAARSLSFKFPGGAVVVDILSVVILAWLGFNVLVHYTAQFTYTLTDNSLRLNRQIGKRNREIEIPLNSISSISSNKPDCKYIYNFSPNIFKNKNTKYIIFEYNRLVQAAVVEADDELKKALNNYKKVN